MHEQEGEDDRAGHVHALLPPGMEDPNGQLGHPHGDEDMMMELGHTHHGGEVDLDGLNNTPINDAGAELGLAALRDSADGVKPFYPYSTLIRYAIKGSPGQKLLLEDIYYAIETRFPWFKSAPAGWKNSIRHNLSLNASFQKMPRPLTDRGKGAYWTVNDNVDPRVGVQRIRKKKPRGPTVNGKQHQAQHDAQMAAAAAMGMPMATIPFNPAIAAAIASGQPLPIVEGTEGEGTGEGSSQGPFSGGGRVVYPGFPPFDANMAAAYAAGVPMRFPTNGENVEMSLSPEMDEEGRPIWRSVWLNELIKLQHATAEAERNGQESEWYRGMIERLRVAFATPLYDEEEDQLQQHQQMPEQPRAPRQTRRSRGGRGSTGSRRRRGDDDYDEEEDDEPLEEIDAEDNDNDPDYEELVE